MADPTGFEPAISSVTGWHVGPLHHGSATGGGSYQGGSEAANESPRVTTVGRVTRVIPVTQFTRVGRRPVRTRLVYSACPTVRQKDR